MSTRRYTLSSLAIMFLVLTGCSSQPEAVAPPEATATESGPFTIKSTDFQAESRCDATTGTIEVSMQNGEVQAKFIDYKFKASSGMPLSASARWRWCSGAKQQFVGTVKEFGYTFESDASDPLTFVVDRDKGFYYSAGKGKVTDPEGKVTTLP